MDLVEVGVVARPHGFRGAFVAVCGSGRESALGYARQIYIDGVAHEVREAAWMPSGWKLQLEGIADDTTVRALRGHKLFVDRSQLKDLEKNEYYLADLQGMRAVDADSGEDLGIFTGIEGGGGNEWWVIEGSSRTLNVPPRKHYIAEVDTAQKVIRLRNVAELT